jgi:hypothetical protein
MADFVFNIAKGSVNEYANRVEAGDPSTARLRVILLASTGLETQAVLEDANDVTALVAGATDLATNTGVTRKEVGAANLAVTTDDTGDTQWLDIDDQTWSSVANDGTGAIGALVVVYDPNSVADGSLIPLTHHDFAVTPDGSDITAQVAAGGIFSAA